ncbi:trimeric LpxA-like protein [Hesseltinella vesiculosa]|uniref:Dynactin subunit 6 n=1 Tax=Hesseltinella vesiculosa TaxID=101127 RepID=A0A1X2GDH6_9FUNG|nr:trimeric LpxA-like protein [Hesseltinella vesiculosa]
MPGNRNRVTAGSGSVVCQEAELKGEITIGTGTVLHPKCRIIAEGGPIYIGKNNIIEENSVIFNKNVAPLVIGDDNVFEVSCYVEGSRVGNCNTIGTRAKVLGNTTIGNNCVIGPGCSTESNETVEDMTVVYGQQPSRRIQSSILPGHSSLHTRHLEYLREMLPKYNHVKRLESSG